MDRNWNVSMLTGDGSVALRKESVDRNGVNDGTRGFKIDVALRKESVDRNREGLLLCAQFVQSLSARRAWIEIASRYRSMSSWNTVALRKESVDRNCFFHGVYLRLFVALRKESVDRNPGKVKVVEPGLVSLSARRAWIEIGRALRQLQSALVALRKESVDRNYMGVTVLGIQHRSLSARRAWIEIRCSCRSVWLLACRSPQGERG